MSKAVSLQYLDNYDVNQVQMALEKAFIQLDLHKLFKPKMKVLIKPNLPVAEFVDKAETTNPAVVQAVINILSDLGVNCIIADSPYKKFSLANLESVYFSTGMLEVANLTTCELNQNLKTTTYQINDGLMTKSVAILDVFNEVDAIINLGKVKINENVGYLGAVSNILGLIPGEFKTVLMNRLHTVKDFNNLLIDLWSAVKDKIQVNILDGIVALEANKTQRLLSCLAVSQNPFSLDATMLDIIGVDKSNSIINQAADRELIDFDKPYKLTDEEIDRFKLSDFALNDVQEDSLIHKNKATHKKQFKHYQKRVIIPQKNCKGCSICSKICPSGAISMEKDKNNELYAKIDYDKCIFCFKCLNACPYKVTKVKIPSGYRKVQNEIDKYND